MTVANDALWSAQAVEIPVVEVLKILNDTRMSDANRDRQEACDCVEDIVLAWVALKTGASEVSP